MIEIFTQSDDCGEGSINYQGKKIFVGELKQAVKNFELLLHSQNVMFFELCKGKKINGMHRDFSDR